MRNKEVEMANAIANGVKRIKEINKGFTGLKKAVIESALAIAQLFSHPVPGTKNNPIKFSKRYKRK